MLTEGDTRTFNITKYLHYANALNIAKAKIRWNIQFWVLRALPGFMYLRYAERNSYLPEKQLEFSSPANYTLHLHKQHPFYSGVTPRLCRVH